MTVKPAFRKGAQPETVAMKLRREPTMGDRRLKRLRDRRAVKLAAVKDQH